MKQKPVALWKRSLSLGLSLAMTVTLLPSTPAFAELSHSASLLPTIEKAGSVRVPMTSETPATRTQEQPFETGTGGSQLFRIPAVIQKRNSPNSADNTLLAIADARHGDSRDGYGIDTIASISGDYGKTWDYGFPFVFPDSDLNHTEAASFIDPGLIEGPDGTVYLIADAFPAGYNILGGTQLRGGTGYLTIEGKPRLVLTEDASKITTEPKDTAQGKQDYPFYVGDFSKHDSDPTETKYAYIIRRSDGMKTNYMVDEWYNLYSRSGNIPRPVMQGKLGNSASKIQMNLFYRDSQFHVYKTGYLWCIKSTDGGRTWKEPVDITPQVKTNTDMSLLISPGHGITTSDGTIAIGAYRHYASGEERASILYSNDNGVTWNRTAEVAVQSSENDIVELDDGKGTLRMFYRHTSNNIQYVDFTPRVGGGYTVKPAVTLSSLTINSSNNVTAIAYSKKILGKQAILFGCAAGPYPDRKNGRIYTFLVEADGSMSLHNIYSIPNTEDNYHYSSITELLDGSIGLLWENTGTSIRYDRLEMKDIIGDINVEGMTVDVSLVLTDTGKTSQRTYMMTAEAPTAANGNKWTAKAFDCTPAAPQTVVPVTHTDSADLTLLYAVNNHVNSRTQNAFESAFVTYADLKKAMLTFDKVDSASLPSTQTTTSDSAETGYWRVSNETTGRNLSLRGGHAEDMFLDDEKDILRITWDKENKVMKMQGINNGTDANYSSAYGIFFQTYSTFNISGSSSQEGCQYGLTLWKPKAAANIGGTWTDEMKKNPLLYGFEKLETDAGIVDGESYLVTYVDSTNDKVYYLNPESGTVAQTKLLNPTQPSAYLERTITITAKDDPKKLIERIGVDGVYYRIRIDKQEKRTTMKVGQKMTLPSPYSAAEANKIIDSVINEGISASSGAPVLEGKLAADVKVESNNEVVLYDHTSNTNGSLNSFASTPNNSVNLDGAGLTFIKDTGGTNKWKVKSTRTNKYFWTVNGGDDFWTSTEVSGVVEKWPASKQLAGIVSKNTVFRFYYGTSVGSRPFFFYRSQMNFNKQGSVTNDADSLDNFRMGMTLWEKSENAPADSLIPGYQVVSDIVDGHTYLVTHVWNNQSVILLYPPDTNSTEGQVKLIGRKTSYPDLSLRSRDRATTGNMDLSRFVDAGDKVKLSEAEFEIAITPQGATSGDQYVITAKNGMSLYAKDGSANYFAGWSAARSPITITDVTEPSPVAEGNPVGFRLSVSSDAHLIFWKANMYFNRGNSSQAGEIHRGPFILMKKKDTVSPEDPLPGYEIIRRKKDIVSGEKYLIATEWVNADKAAEAYIVLYPGDLGDGTLSKFENIKLATPPQKMVTITAKAVGEAQYTAGGTTYKVAVFDDTGCTHPDKSRWTREELPADNCNNLPGYTGDAYCDICKQFIESGEEILPTGHRYKIKDGSYQIPVGDTDGWIERECEVCHDTIREKVSAVAFKAYKDTVALAGRMKSQSEALYNYDSRGVNVAALVTAYDACVAANGVNGEKFVNANTYVINAARSSLQEMMRPFITERQQLESTWTALVADANGIERGKYSDEAWNAFLAAKALPTGQELETISYSGLAAAIEGLQGRMTALTAEDDKRELMELWSGCMAWTKIDGRNGSPYTDATWDVFYEARQAAHLLLAEAAPNAGELSAKKLALQSAIDGLMTVAEEESGKMLNVPAIEVSAPKKGNYPTSAKVSSDGTKKCAVIADQVDGAEALSPQTPDAVASIEEKDGIVAFHCLLASTDSKYAVTDGKTTVIAFSFYGGPGLISGAKEVLGKGDSYAVRFESDGKMVLDVGGVKDMITVKASELTDRWHDVVVVISKEKQYFYLDGKKSDSDGDPKNTPPNDDSPFTIGYNQKTASNALGKSHAMFGDIRIYKFADGALPQDYEAVVLTLDGSDEKSDRLQGYITAAPYRVRRYWKSPSGIHPYGTKFEASTEYTAVVELTANGGFIFPDTAEYKESVKNAVKAEGSRSVNVTISGDRKMMTIETGYPATEAQSSGGGTEKPNDGNSDTGKPNDGSGAAELAAAKSALATALSAAEAVYKAGQGAYAQTGWTAFAAAYTAGQSGKDGTDAAAIRKLAETLDASRKALTYAIKVGDTTDIKGIRYTVTNVEAQTADAKGIDQKKLKSAVIESEVTINGITCKVTGIAPNAFKSFTKLKKVTIGANVTVIGKSAFTGCKALSTLTFDRTKLESVAKSCFKGTKSSLKLKYKGIAAADKKALLKALSKSGINKKALK